VEAIVADAAAGILDVAVASNDAGQLAQRQRR
jgi:hypothetical protein